MPADWKSLDWKGLERLRSRYLDPRPEAGDYWESPQLLAAYDLSFGTRIRWKWEAVLDELARRAWSPPTGARVLDWGCGSGAAARAVLARFGAAGFAKVELWDRSPIAREFALARVREENPGLEASVCVDPSLAVPDLLLVSHVLNELPERELQNLVALIRRAKAVLWVEAGTSAVSRKLSALHDDLRGEFQVVGPCTHARPCPLLQEGNERHWCHSFARSPAEAFSDPDWSRFAKMLGIDLRSLPYTYLALDRAGWRPPGGEWTRVLGHPRTYKGFSKVQTCDGQRGVRETILQKRDAPGLAKKLKDLREPPFFRFQTEGDKIVSVIEESEE